MVRRRRARLRVHGDHRPQPGAGRRPRHDGGRAARRARPHCTLQASSRTRSTLQRGGRHPRRLAPGLQRRVPGGAATSLSRRSIPRSRSRAEQTARLLAAIDIPTWTSSPTRPAGCSASGRAMTSIGCRLDAAARTGTAIEWTASRTASTSTRRPSAPRSTAASCSRRLRRPRAPSVRAHALRRRHRPPRRGPAELVLNTRDAAGLRRLAVDTQAASFDKLRMSGMHPLMGQLSV